MQDPCHVMINVTNKKFCNCRFELVYSVDTSKTNISFQEACDPIEKMVHFFRENMETTSAINYCDECDALTLNERTIFAQRNVTRRALEKEAGAIHPLTLQKEIRFDMYLRKSIEGTTRFVNNKWLMSVNLIGEAELRAISTGPTAEFLSYLTIIGNCILSYALEGKTEGQQVLTLWGSYLSTRGHIDTSIFGKRDPIKMFKKATLQSTGKPERLFLSGFGTPEEVIEHILRPDDVLSHDSCHSDPGY